MLQLRLGQLASGGAARALVRAPRRAARRREPVRVARPRRVSREPLRREATRSVLYDRPASAFVPIERAERERFRQALFARLGIRAGTVGFIVCPTSWTEDEDFDVVIDAVLHLEERIRGWEAGDAEPAISRSRDSRHRRRRAPRRVRAAVRRPAGAADSAARAVARARGLPARRRQRRSRPVPAPILVGARHSDEGRRSVRRRRAGAARSTTARASPSACATATTVCCSRPAGSWPTCCSISSRRFPPIRRRSIACAPARASSARPTWEEGWVARGAAGAAARQLGARPSGAPRAPRSRVGQVGGRG